MENCLCVDRVFKWISIKPIKSFTMRLPLQWPQYRDVQRGCSYNDLNIDLLLVTNTWLYFADAIPWCIKLYSKTHYFAVYGQWFDPQTRQKDFEMGILPIRARKRVKVIIFWHIIYILIINVLIECFEVYDNCDQIWSKK